MALPGGSETELILTLMAIATGEAEWHRFLRDFAALTQADQAFVFPWEGAGDAPDVITWAMSPDQAGQASRLSAWLVEAVRLVRSERVYGEEELDDLAGKPDPAAPSLPAIRMMRAGSGASALGLAIVTSRAFRATDGALIRRLHPYLEWTGRQLARSAVERARAKVTAEFAKGSTQGWLLLDPVGRVVDSTLDSGELSDGMRRQPGIDGEQLILADREAGQRLSHWLDHYGTKEETREHAIWLDQARSAVLRLRPFTRDWPAAIRRPVAVATVHRMDRGAQDDAVPLIAELFGVLPSEARLAVALARGDSLTDAAARLQLTLETVRNYSKKLFLKTGAHNQADLVRLILRSGLM